jgi:hypothetical protein
MKRLEATGRLALVGAFVAIGCATEPAPDREETSARSALGEGAPTREGLPPGPTCAGPGVRCNADWECCSADCRNGACRVRPGECGGAGAVCRTSRDCCNQDCRLGTCYSGPAVCEPEGASCDYGWECCSLDCREGACRF